MKKIFACFVTFLLLSMLLITPVKADSCWELYFMFETENGRVCPWDEEDKLNNIKVKNGETVSAIVQADDFYTIQKTEVIVDGKLLDIESVRENMEGHDDVFYLHHRYVATGEQGSEHEVTITCMQHLRERMRIAIVLPSSILLMGRWKMRSQATNLRRLGTQKGMLKIQKNPHRANQAQLFLLQLLEEWL